MYHTQEKRAALLIEPIMCSRKDAWLGEGYYYWDDKNDAVKWGHDSKKSTGYFDIYRSQISSQNILDTVFNEDHYRFWLDSIEKVAKEIKRITGQKATIKEVNQYFKERGSWTEVDGILFQDVSTSQTNSQVIAFYYRKRIQLAVYNTAVIKNFVHCYSSKVK